MLEQQNAGCHLPCPSESNEVTTWSVQQLYNKLSKICYVMEPKDRGSFSDLVKCIESEMSESEKNLHEKMNKTYIQIRENNYIDKQRHNTT